MMQLSKLLQDKQSFLIKRVIEYTKLNGDVNTRQRWRRHGLRPSAD